MAATSVSNSTQTATDTLRGSGLRLERGSRTVIDNISFSIASGHALILRGTNGSGKTSLLRMLAGLTLPDAGAVWWNGEPLKALSTTWRNVALYLGHNNALKDDFTAHENLVDALSIDGISIAPSTQLEALEKVGLIERRHVLARRLSQGQKRRIGLARLWLALSHAHHKPLWLLDEPTNALDSDGVLLFTDLIGGHLGRGGIACIATHLALDIASRATEMNLDSRMEVAQ